MSRPDGQRRGFRLLPTALILLAISLSGAIWLWPRSPPPPPEDAVADTPCAEQTFQDEAFVVCILPPDQFAVSIAHNEGQTKADAGVMDALRTRTAQGAPPLLVMNAGMYDADLDAIGLLIEHGRQLHALNTRDGPGNFHMKPNGVFAVDRQGQASVTPSERWKSDPEIAFATQSGPMLVVDGDLHPAFDENGPSRYRRNGVGVRADGAVVLVISRSFVSFGVFARLFRDVLHCPDALFLDGAVSALAGPDGPLVGGTAPAGPVIIVDRKSA